MKLYLETSGEPVRGWRLLARIILVALVLGALSAAITLVVIGQEDRTPAPVSSSTP